MDGLELVNVELLVDKPNLEIDRTGRWQIDGDLIDIEPKQESLHLNTFQISNGTITQFSGYGLIVVDQVLELNVARAVQRDDEPPIFVEDIVGDCAG